jgi:putative spermidine/putrescine transport system substrate-binding protein
MGTAFAVKGAQQGILAPYKVATWASIPADAKASDGTWFADYGGFVAIGYNSDKVKTPPTSFADLLKPEYKNQVAINGNPTQARTFLGSVTRVGVQLSGDVAVQVDRPSAEAAALAAGASVVVSLPAQPVLVAARRVS